MSGEIFEDCSMSWSNNKIIISQITEIVKSHSLIFHLSLFNVEAVLTSPQNSATPGEDKNMSAIFGCEEEWEKDLSILSDEASVISETKMSSTTSESFLSATSFVSTPRS